MLYCEPCAEKNNWPKIADRTVGDCKYCSQRAVCYNAPSSDLPQPKEPVHEVIKGHPLPWRFSYQPKGWGMSSVIFDADNQCVMHTSTEPKIYRFLTEVVNKAHGFDE